MMKTCYSYTPRIQGMYAEVQVASWATVVETFSAILVVLLPGRHTKGVSKQR